MIHLLDALAVVSEKVYAHVHNYEQRMQQNNQQNEADVLEEKSRLHVTCLKVRTEGIYVWEVKHLIEEIICRNYLEGCDLYHELRYLHRVGWEFDIFEHRHVSYELLAIEQTPKRRKRPLED